MAKNKILFDRKVSTKGYLFPLDELNCCFNSIQMLLLSYRMYANLIFVGIYYQNNYNNVILLRMAMMLNVIWLLNLSRTLEAL